MGEVGKDETIKNFFLKKIMKKFMNYDFFFWKISCNVITTPCVGCEDQKTTSGRRFSLSTRGSKDQTQVIRLACKHFHPVNHSDAAWDSVVNDIYRIIIMCPCTSSKQ